MCGLYKCMKCNQYYTLSEEHDKYITEKAKLRGSAEAVSICSCGKKHISGAQFIDGAFHMYGVTYDEQFHKNRRKYPAKMLKEVNENDHHEFSTYEIKDYSTQNGQTIYLTYADLHECIINQKIVCPHKEIFGKICSDCKIPDSTCPICKGTDYKHYLDCTVWKILKEKENK